MATITGYTKERMKLIEDNAIVGGQVVSGELILVRYDGTTLSAGNVIGPQGVPGPGGTPGDATVSTAKIIDGSVTTSKLDVAAVTGTILADDSVNSQHYVNGSIDRAHLAADIIDSTKIENDALRSEHYQNGSIDREHLAADIIDSSKIANDSINSEHYVNGSIDALHLSSGSVTNAKLGSGAVDLAKVSSTDWVPLTLGFGWSNYGGRQAAQWRKVMDEVQLRGTIRFTTAGWVNNWVFSLPSGARPVAADSYPGTSTGADRGMYWFIEPDGFGQLYNGSSSVAAVSLTGVRFSTTA